MTAPSARQASRSGIYDFASLGPSHRTVLDHVPAGARVLELGCATGYMTRGLLSKGCRVVAVDIDAPAIDRLRDTSATTLVVDLESPEQLEGLAPLGPFDVIVLADVLEHLREPEQLLRAVRQLLSAEGTCVVSLPNVAFWRIRINLLRGRWDYTDVGILDRTHLRFYTPRTVAALAADGGFDVESRRDISESFPLASLFVGRSAWLKHRLDGLVFRLWPAPFTYQMVLRLSPVRRR